MTQREAVMQYMHEFGSITSYQAFADLGITRLAARISDLAKLGVLTKKEMVERKNRYGKTVYFAQYSLVEDKKND